MLFSRPRHPLLGLLGVFVALGLPAGAQEASVPPAATGSVISSEQLVAGILDDYETYRLAYDPAIAARQRGEVPRSWPDISPQRRAAERAEAEALLDRVRALGQAHTLDTTILESILTSKVRRLGLDPDRIPFTGDSGFHSEPGFEIGTVRVRNIADAEALIARINAIPGYFESNIENMRRGIASGHTAYVDPLSTTIEQLQEITSRKTRDNPLFKPFENLPGTIDASTAIRLRSEARAAVEKAMTSYLHVQRFLEQEYAPAARRWPGINSLRNGRAIYLAEVAHHTTLPDLTPERIHDIGLAEVARIRAQMEDVIAETGFDGTFAEFLAFLRTDPQFYAQTPDELLAEAAVLSKKLDATLPRFFGKLPRLTYGVSPVPAEIAPGYTTARYSGGDAKTGRAGTYLVNTYRLDQRPLYEMPALTAHEAVPGHHLQIALAQELENVPEFRRAYYATAFGEGWGLYAELIAGEAGLYDTPYKRFGALSYEMWRACRLVADTGLHWYGWSREEAEACFRDNSALAELNIQIEVTRYIGWPGQALGYKIGEITIRQLRAEAETALGDAFDLRAFHDLVLAEGALPLSLLEARVGNWIASQRADGTSAPPTAP